MGALGRAWAALVLAGIAGCGGATVVQNEPGTGEADLTGEWSRSVDPMAIPPTVPPYQRIQMAGEWTLRFSSSGSFHVVHRTMARPVGRWSADGSELVIVEPAYDAACAAPGRYAFVVGGDVVDFTLLDDPCVPRRAVIGGGRFTRQ
jgi:hypothetical protein